MTGTMTWVGSMSMRGRRHAAAIDVMTGRAGADAVRSWGRGAGRVAGGSSAVRCTACYEAGPDRVRSVSGSGRGGDRMEVVAPGKTPRGPSDRVKTDRKDAELLARFLLAASSCRSRFLRSRSRPPAS